MNIFTCISLLAIVAAGSPAIISSENLNSVSPVSQNEFSKTSVIAREAQVLDSASATAQATDELAGSGSGDNSKQLAIEYPQSEIAIPTFGDHVIKHNLSAIHRRVPTPEVASDTSGLPIHHSSRNEPTTTNLSTDEPKEPFEFIVELTLRGTNRELLRRPLVITLDHLVPEASATIDASAGPTQISESHVAALGVTSSELNSITWNTPAPALTELETASEDVIPVSVVATSHHRHHNRSQQVHATATYILPEDEANQLNTRQVHKVKLENLAQTTQSMN
ncbi:hypothetical protein IWW56_002900 [Coemansia sp. RSA 2131]|nr:hypothetical protein IWW56_002900 [Coemansia sp. RSA 2131]